MIGQRISHYEIIEKLGEGGMGVVYKARDTRLERDVALKFLHPDTVRTRTDRTRFYREARVLASLEHPNICSVYELDEAGGRPFIAMAFIRGESLRDVVRKSPLDVDTALDVIRQVARGLQAAHEKGVVHRDIKSSNIIMTPQGDAKILDFGLARLSGHSLLTAEGIMVGTAAYMSPEQSTGDTVDHRTDIWALGVLLYELVTGELPFQADFQPAVVYQILNEQPKKLADHLDQVPSGLQETIDRALAKNVLERFQSIGEFMAAIDTIGRPDLPGARTSEAQPATTPPAAAAGARRDSIAILPLANLNDDPDSEYFSDGITEDIITHVSRIPGLKVISRTSVMRFKNTDKSLREIGTELRVGTILEGSVRRSGDRVRIVAQLIDADLDQHLWAETYDRKLFDVFAIQSDVAQKIAAALRAELSDSERDKLDRKPTEDMEAYQRYLKGRFFLGKRNEEGLRRAISHFQAALEADPTFSLAYAGIADCYNLLPWYGVEVQSDAFRKAKAAAQQALLIDDSLAEAHTSLAFATMLYDWDWSTADREFLRAVELNSGYAAAHHWYFEYLIVVGRIEEAMKEIRHAYELDPLSLIINSAIGWGYYFQRRYERAIEQTERTLDMDPDFIWARFIRSKAQLRMNLPREVIADARASASSPDDHPLMLATLGTAHAMAGDAEQARTLADYLDRLGHERYVSPYFVAMIHLGLGNVDAVIGSLERAFEKRDFWLVFLRADPLWDPLRDEPRFRGLIGRLGLS